MEHPSSSFSTNLHSSCDLELYFIIAKFLSAGPCKQSSEVLLREIQEHGLIPERLDWQGDHHKRSYAEFEALHPDVTPDHLGLLLSQLRFTVDKFLPIPHLTPSRPSFLSKSRLSLLRRTLHSPKVLSSIERILSSLRWGGHDPPCRPVLGPSLHGILTARSLGGRLNKRHLFTNTFYASRLQLHKRTVGHLSSVYCVLFDRTGRYIVTGSDDTLVKVWSVRDGRLLATLRGAAGEISDIAIDPENTMVAAGCCDKTIRVWNLQTLSPIAVLVSHSGMITAVQFCPSPDTDEGEGLLVSTGGDGCVVFWTYVRSQRRIVFKRKPLKYNERVRPGHAQLICCSFSAGGTMLALGGVDHHVRVYRFGGCDGLEKMIERAEHSDCVDSIQWCHEGLAFASGSRDGTALIWRYKCQAWHTTRLHMNITEPGNPPSSNASNSTSAAFAGASRSSNASSNSVAAADQKKVLVTMVGWSLDDVYVVTCSSDHLVRVWDSTSGSLVRLLTGHTDDAFVVEAHPTDVNIVLTAGHDGQLMIWNLRSGALVCSFKNAIEGQGHGALFDAKWSPDGLHVAATDSHGHICLYGMGTNELCYKVPQELFFHTDYRPLVRDLQQYVLDEQTQLAPHLMPPPFLVNIDGNPYPPALQRLVPGRENCEDTMLVPNVIFNANGDREVFDVAELNAVNAIHNHANADLNGAAGADDDEEDDAPPLPAPRPQPPPPPPPPRPSDSPGFLSPDSVAAPEDRPLLVDQMIERFIREQQEQINLSFGRSDNFGPDDQLQTESSSSGLPLVSPSPITPRPSSSTNFTFGLPGPSAGDARVPPPIISPLMVPRSSSAANGPSSSSDAGPSTSLPRLSPIGASLSNERRLSTSADGDAPHRRLSSSSSANPNLPGPSGINSLSDRRTSHSDALQERHRINSGAEHSYAAVASNVAASPGASRGGARLVGDVEGVRHSTGDWQRESLEVNWTPRRVLVRPLSPSVLRVSRERRVHRADQEEQCYLREAAKPPLLTDGSDNSGRFDGRNDDVSPRSARMRRQQQRRQQQQRHENLTPPSVARSSNSSSARGSRPARGTTARSRNTTDGGRSSYATRANREVGRGRYSLDYEDPNAVASHDSSNSEESDLSSSSNSSSSGESSDYSDWTAEQGVNLEPPKRTAHRQKKSPSSRRKLRHARNAASDDNDEDEDQVNTSSEQQTRISKRERRRNPRYLESDQAEALGGSSSSDEEEPQLPTPARQRREVRGRVDNLNESSDSEPGEIPEAYRPPEWLTETQPKRAPYFPQMGDELMYFMQGHMAYAHAVAKRKLYNLDTKSLPWNKPNSNIKECEYVKIIGIKYEIRPPRLCCLKLAILNANTNRISTDTFTLKYHDIPDVLDFLVLKQMHDVSAARNWQVGDRFRCIIDDAWWLGTVTRRELSSEECPESLFMCYFVTWDNGETEKLSPWDMEPIGDVANADESGAGINVSAEELERLRYKWTCEDWPEGRDGADECSRLAHGLGLVMSLSVAEPFLAPVDLSVYPNYAMIVEYPMDLSTIKSRLENGFYRRLNAVQFDVRYIATNAEKFNQRGSNIVRQARIVTELCLDLIKNPLCRDPTARYHEIAKTYHSPNASDLDAPGPSGASTSIAGPGRGRGRRRATSTPGSTWQQQCREVLRAVFEREDSMPFRYPVDLEQYPDYDRVIEVPMDLTTVREELATQSYDTPHEFAADVRLIFCNSKSYNTNKKSKIYSMTVRLEAFFDDKMRSVFANYQAQEKALKKNSKRQSKSRPSTRKAKSATAATSTSAETRPSSSLTSSARGHTLRSTPGIGRGVSLSNLTSASVRLRRLTNHQEFQFRPSRLESDSGEHDSDNEDVENDEAAVPEDRQVRINKTPEEDEDSHEGEDSLGARRSKRVAKLKRLQSSDDSDEDYSPVKKRVMEGSGGRGRRKALAGSSKAQASESSTSSVGVRPRITVQYQEDSDSAQDDEYGAPSSLHTATPNNSNSSKSAKGKTGGVGSTKRVVLKLSLPQESDQADVGTSEDVLNAADNNEDNVSGSDDVWDKKDADDGSEQNESASGTSVKRKLAVESSDDETERNSARSPPGEARGESVENSAEESEDEAADNATKEAESTSDDVSRRPKKRRKLNIKSVASESSDSDHRGASQKSKTPIENGRKLNKKKVIPNIGRKMPIYEGSLLSAFGKKKQKEDSEFECDANDFQSSEEYSEEEAENKSKKLVKKKLPRVRKSRRTVLDGDDVVDDEDFVVDDSVHHKERSDESNSLSSSSSSSSSSSTSSDEDQSEESDEIMSGNQKKKLKKDQHHKRSKGVLKSSAGAGKKLPLKFKPGQTSKNKRGGKSKAGKHKTRKEPSSLKRKASWLADDDEPCDYESGDEVMDGEEVIGTVSFNSDDDNSEGYSPRGRGAGPAKKRGGRGGRRGASTAGFRRAIDACQAEEVRKSSRGQRKVRYDETEEDYFDEFDDLNVSSRGRVRRANTMMKDFI